MKKAMFGIVIVAMVGSAGAIYLWQVARPSTETEEGLGLAAAGSVPSVAQSSQLVGDVLDSRPSVEESPKTGTSTHSGEPAGAAKAPGKSREAKGLAALNQAARSKKILFLLLYDTMDDRTQELKRNFETLMQKHAAKAESVVINTLYSAERGLIEKFNLSQAPMPLILAVAPNGAITGGFPKAFDEDKLTSALVSPCMQMCLKALQDRKLVVLCVQNKVTTSNAAAMQGVNELKNDKRYAPITEIVKLDPSDTQEAALLRNLRIDPKTAVATTALLSPPGSLIARISGATSKKLLLAKLAAASSG